MQLKFNSGNGAVLCEKCSVIIVAGFSTNDYDVIDRMQEAKCVLLCEECFDKYQEQE